MNFISRLKNVLIILSLVITASSFQSFILSISKPNSPIWYDNITLKNDEYYPLEKSNRYDYYYEPYSWGDTVEML